MWHMHQEEGSIYSLNTINNGSLLQKKTTSKPYLKRLDIDLPTLDNIFKVVHFQNSELNSSLVHLGI
jgi:hypothetical protein